MINILRFIFDRPLVWSQTQFRLAIHMQAKYYTTLALPQTGASMSCLDWNMWECTDSSRLRILHGGYLSLHEVFFALILFMLEGNVSM